MRFLPISLIFMVLGLFVLSMSATHLLENSHVITNDYGNCEKCHPQESKDISGHAGLTDCLFCHEGKPELGEEPHSVVSRHCIDCHSSDGVSKDLSSTDVLSEFLNFNEGHEEMAWQQRIDTVCISCHSQTPATIVNGNSDMGKYYEKSHSIDRDFRSLNLWGYDWNADFCRKCHPEIVNQLEEVRGNSFHGWASCSFCHGGSTEGNYHVIDSYMYARCSNCHDQPDDCYNRNQSPYPCCTNHDIRGCDAVVCTPSEDNDCSTWYLRVLDDTAPCCKE